MTNELSTLLIFLAGYGVWTRRLNDFARSQKSLVSPPKSWPRVSVIIPARNEAANLPRLLTSLAALKPAPLEIIVVDDHSRDGTGDVARQHGARVVTPLALPQGWLGKPWACAAGAAEARGELLLFTDADTWHAPKSLGTAVAVLQKSGAALVSMVPAHIGVSWWEKLQGTFQLMLLIATRAGGQGAPKGEREYAIGQYLLFERTTYARVGGHAAVRHRVAEDLAFQKLIRDQGGTYLLVTTPGLLMVRMYPGGFGDFLRGWRRNFREGMRAAGVRGVAELVVVIGWLWGLPLAVILDSLRGRWLGATLWAVLLVHSVFEVRRRQRLVWPLPRWGAWGTPLMVGAFVWCSLTAALENLLRSPVRWRGRAVPQTQLR